MALADADRALVVEELGRDPTRTEAALFENLWSEHCAYRSSRPLLSAFGSDGEQVVVGPGDDAAVVAVDEDTYLAVGIESHNHPSYVDPYDGAATGVGGIVRDILSMGAYPIALADCLYFGPFDEEHPRYLFEGVVEGIADYGNSIGVPTVSGSVAFHPDYEGNPLVNVACVGLLDPDRLLRAGLTEPGNRLVLVGNATGRDGLGGASFASEDLGEDAETEDRPAVQVGDPYTEKLLIEANEDLIEGDLVEAGRDLGAAGLGGATCEMTAIGGLGVDIDLEAVHRREPGMNATEILLSESQERMCYEVAPENVAAVRAVAERYDLGSAVVGDVTEGRYVCTFEGETVVDLSPGFAADGAPMNDLDVAEPDTPERDLPQADPRESFEAVVGDPNTASKQWIYRQYDHEVGVRTALRPGDDAAVLALREAGVDDGGVGLALSAGANPRWTAVAPREGARGTAVENATNLAATGATPLAAVDCLNGGNPEKPEVYGGFRAVIEGLAAACEELSVPVVGGNVSLYNDSAAGPIPPTPTVAMLGTRPDYDAPTLAFEGGGTVLLVGGHDGHLGGSAYLAQAGGSDRFPGVSDPQQGVEAVRTVATHPETTAVHDVSDGGLAVALAEMIGEAGAAVEVPDARSFFSEAPGRAVVETTAPADVREVVDAPVAELGETTHDGTLSVAVGDETLTYDAAAIRELRAVIERELG